MLSRLRLRTVLALCLATIGFWAFFSLGFVPWLIGRAYHGRSFSFINQLISGSDQHPLEMYLNEWSLYSYSGFGLLGICSLYLIVESWLGRRFPPPAAFLRDHAAKVSRWEQVKAYSVVLVIVLPTIYCTLIGKEYWPYSNFPMYSVVSRQSRQSFYLVAVAPSGSRRLGTNSTILPMGEMRFQALMQWMRNQPDGQARLEDFLRDIGPRFRDQTKSQATEEEAFQKIQLVMYEWTLQSGAVNYFDPERTTVLAEVTLPPEKGD